jgi:predicted nucleic acid-binding protein
MSVLFDTSILIDCLRGNAAALKEINRYPTSLISIVNWIEVMSGAQTADESEIVRGFLSQFECVEVDAAIAEQAARLRQTSKLKLLDAVVLATAQVHHAVLVTRDTNFPAGHLGVRIPYRM